MEYRTFEDTLMVRLNPGEEICRSLLDIAEKEKIELAEITGLGAVDRFTTGVFDIKEKVFKANVFTGLFEVTSLIGTLTTKDNSPYLHLHFSAGDEKGMVYGGHLVEAYVSATAEIVIRKISGRIERKMSETISLNLFSFE